MRCGGNGASDQRVGQRSAAGCRAGWMRDDRYVLVGAAQARARPGSLVHHAAVGHGGARPAADFGLTRRWNLSAERVLFCYGWGAAGRRCVAGSADALNQIRWSDRPGAMNARAAMSGWSDIGFLALQRPALRPAAVRWRQPDLMVEDLGTLRDTHLADDRPGLGGHNPDMPVVSPAQRTGDVAELGRIIHPTRVSVSVQRALSAEDVCS